MKSKFARAPLALAVSMLLSQSAGAALFEPIDLSLAPASKKNAVADATPRLSIPMRPLLAGYDAKKLDPESIARAHLGMMFSQQDAAKVSLEAFELSSVSGLENGANLVQFKRRVNGIEVFREDVGLLLDGEARLVAFRGRGALLASASAKSLAVFGLSAVDAAAVALSDYGYDSAVIKQSLQTGRSEGDYQWYDTQRGLRSAAGAVNYQPVRTKPVYFPTADAGLVPAYYVETQVQPDEHMSAEYYAHVISAVDGRVLFRHSQQADGTPTPDTYTYRVWGEATADGWPQPSPYGRNDIPHPTGLPGFIPSFVAQTDVTIRNKPFSMNDPWLPAATSVTTGNNADGYADLAEPDGFDVGDLRATTTAANQFLHTYNTASAPNVSNTQIMASVVQQFYWNNWLHDDYYDSGFAEVDGNAQNNNFGRGGLGSDRIKSEGQDNTGTCAPSCANNANMSTPADGASPRMQMYVFSGVSISTLTVNGGPNYTVGVSGTFGAQSFNVTAGIVQALDAATGAIPSTTDGCTALTNAAQVTGKIAFVDRGECGFAVKAKVAQDAGAVGVIIGNVAGSGSPGTAPGMGGTDATVTIGALSLNFADAESIRTILGDANPDTANMQRQVGVGRDGTQDGAVIAHEWGHYLSNRLVANSSGLSNNQGRSMGEGWGDFSALMAMVKEEDRAGGPAPDFSDLYTIGSYASGNSYFAIRRYPYSTQLGKNPLMFRHITNGVTLPASPAPAFGADGGSNSEVHNAGEVWTAALWECYAGLLNDTPRLTFQQARQRMKGYLVAGLKLTPPAPTFTEARDGVLAAIIAQDATDFQICAAGFAKRGMGMLAVSPPRDSTDHAGAVEDSTIGADLATTALSADDNASCDNDGYIDLNEAGGVTVDVRNSGWASLAGGTLTVTSSHPGLAFTGSNPAALAASIPYATQTLNLPVQLNSLPGSGVIQLTATPNGAIVSPPGTAQTIFVRVGANDVLSSTATERFDASNIGWTTQLADGAGSNFLWRQSTLDATGNRVALGPDSGSSGTTGFVTPAIAVGAGPFSITLTHRYQFEGGTVADPTLWDGGQIQISTDNGATWTSIGGAAYDGSINGNSGNPMQGQPVFAGTSTGYPATMVDTINLGTTYANSTVKLRFAIGTDGGAGAPGWELHTVALTGTNAPFTDLVPETLPCGEAVFGNGFE